MAKYLTFDCYDTLIQYSASKRACIHALVSRNAEGIDPEIVVKRQAELEKKLHLGPFRPLNEVLHISLKQAFEGHGLGHEAEYDQLFENSVRFAPSFHETNMVLNELAKHFKLVIVSNSEPEIINDNVAVIGAPIYKAITAGEAKCYKPDLRLFRNVLEKIGCEVSDLIHIGSSFYHDIEPCAKLGWQRVWINRNGQAGNKAHAPYTELPDLCGLPGFLNVKSR